MHVTTLAVWMEKCSHTSYHLRMMATRTAVYGLFRTLRPFSSGQSLPKEAFSFDSVSSGSSRPASSNGNRFAASYNKKPSNNLFKNHKFNDRDRKKTKVVRFNFDSGSDQAKLAVKDIIKQVHGLSPSYKVQTFDPETKRMTVTNLSSIVNLMDFRQEGIDMVVSKQDKPGQPLYPIIKKVAIHEMLLAFSDMLAARKQQELLLLGSSSARRAANQKQQAERKKLALKIVPLSWSINNQDLANQKYNEIARRVKKQEKFFIYLGDKQSLFKSKRLSEEGRLMDLLTGITTIRNVQDEALEIELRKREKIVEKVKEILVELDCPFEESGSVDARAAFNCSPKKVAQTSAPESDEISERELKKQRRMEKDQEKKKKQQKSNVVEDDLDSLYLFKLDD